MALTLVDSSALIAFVVEGHPLNASADTVFLSRLGDHERLAISAVTWSELLVGPQDEHMRALVADFGMTIAPVDARVAEFGAILRRAHAAGGGSREQRRLDLADALILATAEMNPEIDHIVTGDAKWPKVPGVETPITLLGES
jgi:predicted nucleic acid-binding protein